MKSQRASDTGIALVVVLLMLMLLSAVLAGFVSVIVSEQRLQHIERERSESFYAAHGGLEKLTSDIGAMFAISYAPTGAQIATLSATPPTLPGITYPTTSEGIGYGVTFTPNAQGNPASTVRSITTGTFIGFTGLVTPYTLSVTARTPTGGETRLQRQVQTVGIPLFQFGQFSETNLSFHAGGNFNFGGRVHTNGNLFLASGATLTLEDRVSAFGEVVRTHLINGTDVATSHTGDVEVITSPGVYRDLRRTGPTEGSLVTTIGSARNEPTWSTVSQVTYNSNITNGRTGARRLDLPLVTDGATPIDLIRRPAPGETGSSPVFQQRYFSMASLRILLSDTANDITSLPGVTGTAPVALDNVEPVGYAGDATRPPFAEAGAGTWSASYRVASNRGTLGGFIKIEKQVTAGTWQDVTLEILNLGIAGRNLNPASGSCGNTSDISPDAVIRLQRLSELGAISSAACTTAKTDGKNYWPLSLYDTREAIRRENVSTSYSSVYLGGVMHYVELDVRNVSRWFQGLIGTSGSSVLNATGYTVYFSDRRGNRNAAGAETGEYGFEDLVNPASSTGASNGTLDQGEDVNGNGTLDTYGQMPGNIGVAWSATPSPLDASARPTTAVVPLIAKVNPPRFFRRALKLTNGRQGNIVSPGLTVASENAVYIQGDYNANSGFGNPHVACSIAADAVTLLSNSWSDRISYLYPHNAAGRPASNTWYRVAIIAGKGVHFPIPTGYSVPSNFGSDGGAHNFLRFLESWNGDTVYYRGSMASLYYNRQAVGVFKDGDNTYDFPSTRDYRFDTDFLNMNLLPPRTPMFRDVNVLGFTQVLGAPR